MSEEPQGITTREYIEAILIRFEASVKEQVGQLRTDIQHLQTNYVTRAEFDTISTLLRDEIKRVEHDTTEHLKESKTDSEREQQRLLALGSAALVIITIVSNVILNFL